MTFPPAETAAHVLTNPHAVALFRTLRQSLVRSSIPPPDRRAPRPFNPSSLLSRLRLAVPRILRKWGSAHNQAKRSGTVSVQTQCSRMSTLVWPHGFMYPKWTEAMTQSAWCAFVCCRDEEDAKHTGRGRIVVIPLSG